MSLLRLVGDVGGTNTRLGIAENNKLRIQTVRSFANDNFDDFYQVVSTYLSETGIGNIDSMMVAIAGPVADGRGALTNRNWQFSSEQFKARFSVNHAGLMNDLRALGFSLPSLRSDQIQMLGAGDPDKIHHNGQYLVIGVGTGFNVSPVSVNSGITNCPQAEAGHVCLPENVKTTLAPAMGTLSTQFETVEDVFSGRGFHALKAQAMQHAPDLNFEALYTKALAQLSAGLFLQYLPFEGIAFAGGVARHLLQLDQTNLFTQEFHAELEKRFLFSCPITIISDDFAALSGLCAA